jgi:uncharacterized protein
MNWSADPKKAASNLKRHGVSFEDAARVFLDPLADIDDDSAHERGRLNIVGRPFAWKSDLLFVVYIEISDDTVHIISARHATKHERNRYEERT